MKSARTFFLTLLAMIAFASNSLLCRLALKHTAIDAASFTFVRILSGAVALLLLVKLPRLFFDRSPTIAKPGFSSPQSPLRVSDGPSSLRAKVRKRSAGNNSTSSIAGSWPSAFALFIYAAAFSFAYNTLAAGTGALLLFGAVQATMILWGLHKGERLRAIQLLGLAVALTGLVILVFPGLSAPPWLGSVLMLSAGVAWGIYSLRGKGETNPASATAGNFLRAVPFGFALSIMAISRMHFDSLGAIYAILSGAITSGLGYVIWYRALPCMKSTSAATVQLSVPVLTAIGGILLLGEPITLRLLLASIAVLGGIALVVTEKKRFRDNR